MICIRIRSKKETAMLVFWDIYPFCPCLLALLATLKVVHDPSTSSHQRSSQALGTRLQLPLCVPGQQLQQPWPKQTLTRIAIEMIEMDMKKDVKTEMRKKRMNLTEEIMEVEVLEALEAWEALQVLEAKGGQESVQKRRLRDCHQMEKGDGNGQSAAWKPFKPCIKLHDFAGLLTKVGVPWLWLSF